jgi:hypothetical protein
LIHPYIDDEFSSKKQERRQEKSLLFCSAEKPSRGITLLSETVEESNYPKRKPKIFA